MKKKIGGCIGLLLVSFLLTPYLCAQDEEKTGKKQRERSNPKKTDKSEKADKTDKTEPDKAEKKEEPPAVRVGKGYVTVAEYEAACSRMAINKGIKAKDKAGALSPAETRQALDECIADEMILQAAIEGGILQEKDIRWAVTTEFRNNTVNSLIDSRKFTDDQLGEYYQAHPEKFKKPSEIHLMSLEFAEGKKDPDYDKSLKQAKKDPSKLQWKDMGWVSEKKNLLLGLKEPTLEKVLTMKVGDIVEGFAPGLGGKPAYIIKIEERNEEDLPFDRAMGKIRFEIVNDEVQKRTAELIAEARKANPKLSEDDALLEMALKAGSQRTPTARATIQAAYIAKKKQTREELLAVLKKKVKVEILLKEEKTPSK